MTELAMDYQEPFDNAFTRPAARPWKLITKTLDCEISTKKKYPLNSHPDGAKVSIISLNFVNHVKIGKVKCYTENVDFVRAHIGETARYAGKTLHAYVDENGICQKKILTDGEKLKAFQAMYLAMFYEEFYTPKWLEKYPEREESYNRIHADINKTREFFSSNFSPEKAEEIKQTMAQKVAKAEKYLND